MNTLDLTINGMHCDGCANRIHSLLEKEIGVRKVSISHEVGTGSVVFNSQAIDEEKIITIIEHAGFTVGRA